MTKCSLLLAPLAALIVAACSEGMTGAEVDQPAFKRLAGSAHGGTPLSASLTGQAEVPPVESGSGIMDLTLNSGQREICFTLSLQDVASPTRAHIHRGVAGQNGGVEVFFFDTVIPEPIPVPDPLRGCVWAPRDLIKEIRKTPANFYINVHNDDFPGGAVRGQLTR